MLLSVCCTAAAISLSLNTDVIEFSDNGTENINYRDTGSGNANGTHDGTGKKII